MLSSLWIIGHLLSQMCCPCLSHSPPTNAQHVTSSSAFLFSFPRQVLFLSSCLHLFHLWFLTVSPLLPYCHSVIFICGYESVVKAVFTVSNRLFVVLLERWGWRQRSYSAMQNCLIPKFSVSYIIVIITPISGGGGSLLRPSQVPANLLGPAAESRTSRWYFMCLDGIRGTFHSATKYFYPGSHEGSRTSRLSSQKRKWQKLK